MASTQAVSASLPQVQDFERMMQLATGMGITAALQPITRMGIADLLADGPLSVMELAQKTGSNADALYRVMRLLASAGVFAELPGREFALTPMSELLRADTPVSLRDFVVWVSNSFHFKVWPELGHSIRTGKPGDRSLDTTCFVSQLET
jgi:hypothetical protein